MGYFSKNAISYGWKQGLRRAGIRERHPYQSRHTYACWSLSAGANPSFIATQMGHEDSRRVYVVYAKWIGDMDKDQVTIITNRITTGLPPSRPQSVTNTKKCL
ncbi:tyrosine-type recombinase/integrase [Enterobacter mori]|uniref:Tyrosine-type recombinase/integrase n=1 Tax=Enterobacter mori TaxID=539813 RepID=A0A7T0DZL9_9ENTR|nr:tyrosine-type recombinase/integrase [Enterobacter mori]